MLPSHGNCTYFLKSTLNDNYLNSSLLPSSFSADLLSLRPFSESSASSSVCKKDQVFDFETSAEANCFQLVPVGSGTKTLSSSKKTVKLGQKSLKWHATSTSPSSLQLDFATGHHITSSWLRRGGVKVWLYKNSASPGKQLKAEFKDTSDNVLCLFNANLNFKGWRGIWVKFSECKPSGISVTSSSTINRVLFTLTGADTIYIDILEFKNSLGKQTRDKIVPPINGRDLYDAANTWQRSYHWSQQPAPDLPSTVDVTKNLHLDVIKSRMMNWYLDETKTTTNFPAGSFLEHRWNSLLGSIQNAHKSYDDDLVVENDKIVGPPLFCRDCRNEKKFGEVITKILFPLALEYHIRSRTDEIDSTATDELANLNSAVAAEKNSAYQAIAGKHQAMQDVFRTFLPSSSNPLTKNQVKNAIKALNCNRLSKINHLLDYVKDQGFADGSGLGSLDHEMNRVGAGFSHSLLLLSDSLNEASNRSRLLDLIETAKWYNDFGEVYQSPAFEYKGTTADRMITILHFRVMIVLVMPKSTDQEKKARIRDMDAIVRWMNNAFAVNDAFGGVIKPDYTGFHHKAIYGSAYVPQALQVAGLVKYLLHGTKFSLSETSVNNIRRGLEVIRLMAAKYSSPNSINGRFPNYSNKVLIKAALGGYAYFSVANPPATTVQSGITVTDVEKPEMFLRLYDENDAYTITILRDGSIRKSKYYLNSLGALDLMKNVS